MSKQTAKHRMPSRLLRYPLSMYIYGWKNRWYYFVKPDLKKKIQSLKETVNDYASRNNLR